jgi:hypothetical protein
MKNPWLLAALSALIMSLSVSAVSGGQPSDLTPVTILRLLNTAQMASHSGFLTLDQLVQSDAFSVAPAIELRNTLQRSASSHTIVVGEYSVSMVVAGDGRSYRASAVATERCAEAWFSSEAGVIYSGRAIGCP